MAQQNEHLTSVVLFFGGQSSEHEISCLTAVGVLGALDTDRFDVCGIGIAKSGRWVRYSAAEIAVLQVGPDGRLPEVDAAKAPAVLLRDGDQVALATNLDDHLTDKVAVDVAIPLLHGPFGEDGTLQGYLEMIGLRYVGAGVAASALGMDKQLSKMAFESAGLQVAPYLTFARPGWTVAEALAAVAASELLYPLYVKPARGGSSVGISRVEDATGLAAALDEARRFDHKAIVEQAVVGAREIECSVLGASPDGDGSTRASQPGEIVVHVKDGFYDYEAKYLALGEADVVVPADLPADVAQRVRETAIRAFDALGGEGLSRVDSFVFADGRIVVNEINTMPGFTPISAYPMMWQADGLSYPDLLSDLIGQALTRPIWRR